MRPGLGALRTVPLNVAAYVVQLPDEDWMVDARCSFSNLPVKFLGRLTSTMTEPEHQKIVDRSFLADHDARWSSGSESVGLRRAIEECLECPVRRQCLEYAAQEGCSIDHGIYGATTAWERRAVMDETGLFPTLSHEDRLDVLQRIADAKELGLVPPSVRLDYLRMRLVDLAVDETAWDDLIAELPAEVPA